MTTQRERRAAMVEQHLAARDITDVAVLRAMGEVERERFVPDGLQDRAYDDAPLPIGHDQTISQPYIVALMIQAAAVGPGDRVLEIGAGSGYAAAVLARIVAEVLAIERHPVLANQAAARMSELAIGNARIFAGDGSEGLVAEAPYDAILVAAAAHEVPPALEHQLAIGGRLVVPIGDEAGQTLCCITRTGHARWTRRELGSVRFVPLLAGLASEQDG